MHRFLLAFCSVFALFIVLNAAPYFLSSAPELRTIGFPAFWRQDPTYMTRVFQPGGSSAHVGPKFYWDRFAVNLCLALAASVGVGRWFHRRGENPSKTQDKA